jgi:hypothetical protein
VCPGRGRGKGAGSNMEDSSQQDRRTDLGLGYLLICISSEGPLSQDGSPDFIAIKSSQNWFSIKE